MLKDRFSTGFTTVTRHALRGIMAVCVAASLSACVAEFRNHGFIPPEGELEQFIVGEATKDTIEAAFGKPQASGLLEASGWYYVRSQFRHYGAFEPKEINRQVLAISFDESGTVSNIERFGLEDGKVITLSRRVTQTNVQGITFISQLLGSVGNLSAEQLLN